MLSDQRRHLRQQSTRDYTVLMEITQFLVEFTQVDCWRLHSFHYGKSLKGLEITQVDCRRLHKLIVGDYTILTMGNPLRV
jgi:hypothetical protein